MFRIYLWQQENDARFGYDAQNQIWRTYQDGKQRAVGPGIRVTRTQVTYTDRELGILLEQQIDVHWRRARAAVESQFGPGSWERLTPRQQYGLVDFWWNGAPALKLAGGMLRNDEATITREAIRYWTVDGRKLPLTRRNKAWLSTFGPGNAALTPSPPTPR